MQCGRWLVVAVMVAAVCSAQVDQRPGVTGEFGKSYHLGTRDEGVEFTLKSVEYSLTRMNVGETCYSADKVSRLLVVHFSMQNASTNTVQANGLVKMVAVTSEKENRDMETYQGVETTNAYLPDNLLPAQRIDCFALIYAPDKDILPKLIVWHNEDTPVVRYNLEGKFKPLPKEYADPADKTGLTPLESLAGKIGAYTPMGQVDLRVDKWEKVAGPIPDNDLAEGYEFFAVTFTLHNQAKLPIPIDVSNFAYLLTEDDSKVENPLLVANSRLKVVELEVKPGAEVTARAVFQVEKDTKIKAFVMAGVCEHSLESKSRPVVTPLEPPKP